MERSRRGGTVVVLAVLLVLLLAGGLTAVLRHDPPRAEALAPRPPAAAPPVTGHVRAFTPPVAPPVRRPVAPAPKPACPKANVRPIPSSSVGIATGRSVTVHDAPGARVRQTLRSPTRDWKVLAVQVLEDRGEWLYVRYNERPNGVAGWIRAREVYQEPVAHHIVVERCARRLTLYERGRPVLQAPVGVGTPRTPTPLGDFYVDFVERRPNPRGSYGPYLISVSGFSEVYMRFGNGGVGQIAIHGTNKPSSVGRFSSNGCVRMHNETVTRIANTVTAGTPVTIVA